MGNVNRFVFLAKGLQLVCMGKLPVRSYSKFCFLFAPQHFTKARQAKNIVAPYKSMKGNYLCYKQVKICFEIGNSYTHLYDQKKKTSKQINNQTTKTQNVETWIQVTRSHNKDCAVMCTV